MSNGSECVLVTTDLNESERASVESAAAAAHLSISAWLGQAAREKLAREAIKRAGSSADIVVEGLSAETLGILPTLIARAPLGGRVKNALENMGVRTVADLVELTERDLMKAKNLGRVSVQELKSYLEQHGLQLGMRQPKKARAAR